MDLALNAQLIADANRGYTFTFTSSTDKTITINDNNSVNENGDRLTRQEILEEIKNQIDANAFSQQDIKELCDFLAYCPTQGMFFGKLTTNNIHIEGDGKPAMTVKYLSSGLIIEVTTKGKSAKNIKSITSGTDVWKYESIPDTKANIKFCYKSKLGECKAKADSIKVNSFSQTLEGESLKKY